MKAFHRHIFFQINCFLIFAFLLTPLVHARSKIRGEIINVNYEYKIAFTDIGSDALSIGDIVEVHMQSGATQFLQVIETTEVLSKIVLRPSSDQDTQNRLFNRIGVGDIVLRVGKGPTPDLEKYSSALSEKTIKSSGAFSNKLKFTKKKETEAINQTSVKYDQLNEEYQQASAKHEQLNSEYQSVKAQLQEMESDKKKLNQHIAYLNAQLTEKSVDLEKLDRENKGVKEILSKRKLDIKKLKNEKQEQNKIILNLQKIIRLIDDQFTRMNDMLK